MKPCHFAEPLPFDAQADAGAASRTASFIYCNPCFGIPPMLIERPFPFFAVQIAVGLTALVAVLLVPIAYSPNSVVSSHW